LSVVVVEFPLWPFFVFHGTSFADGAGGVAVDFDEVCLSGEAQGIGVERKGTQECPACALFVTGKVHMLVRLIAEEGVLVVLKHTLDVDEISTSGAIEKMVERTEEENRLLNIWNRH
jgi:hypothetical protein